MASDGAGNLFVADTYNNTIRKIVIATGAVTTLAGFPGGYGDSFDGTGAAARFYWPEGVASDGAGNLFVTDSSATDRGTAGPGNCTIRKVVIATGTVTTLAGSPEVEPGSADGTGAAAQFSSPSGMASDGAGNLFVVDSYNHTIRKVVIATGAVSTFAGSPGNMGNTDGTGAAARFIYPSDMASDGAGNLFVVDGDYYPIQHRTIRKVVIATGAVTTLAGSQGSGRIVDGTGTAAQFSSLSGMTSDGTGNLFVGDLYTIRRVVIATGEVTTLAGSPGEMGSVDGTGADARFCSPRGVASDGAGNLFVADYFNDTIRKVVIATGAVTTLAGSPRNPGSADGTGADARFSSPSSMASDGAGNLFVVDEYNHTIRKVVVATGGVTTVVGSPGRVGVTFGPLPAGLNLPQGLALGRKGELYITDDNAVLVAEF